LRRVATLVAGEARPSNVFEQLTKEVGRSLALPGVSVLQYAEGHTATVVGAWSEHGTPLFPVGATLDLDADNVVAKVLHSGNAHRVDRCEEASGTLAKAMRSFGYRGAVTAPVTVGGRLWGALAAATASDDPLPAGLEDRLCDFADLVAQALANADAYEKQAASRARLVEVGDAERRRLERNLHDGAQQRLVAVALGLSMVAAKLERDPRRAREILSAAQEDLAHGSRTSASWRARSGHPHGARSRTGTRGAGRACAGAGRAWGIAQGAVGAAASGRRVLRRRRSAHERRDVLERIDGNSQHRPLERGGDGDRLR